jgi:tetratricopeptide (TPR) repeat protein
MAAAVVVGLVAAVATPGRAQGSEFSDGSSERSAATRSLLEDPDLARLTFDQNRADRLSRFPERGRRRPGPAAAPPTDRPAARAVSRDLYLETLAPADLAADAVPEALGGRTPGGTPVAQLAAAEPLDTRRPRLAQSVPYGDLAALLGRDPQAAIARLERLTEANPTDGRLWQLLGAARLSVEAYGQAVGALRRAIGNGRDKPLVRQALGDALLGAGEPQAALQQMRAGPDTGRNRLGRATALVRLDQPKAALPLLEEALQLDPDLEARVRAVRAGALKLAGRRQAAEREVARGRSLTRDRELRASYDRIARSSPGRRPEAWGYNARLHTAYNDNVALRSDSAPGPARDEADFVFEPAAGAWAALYDKRATRLVVDGGVDGAVHRDRGAFDEVFADLGARAAHELSDAWRVSAGAGADYGNIDGDSYLYGARGELELRWRQAAWSETSLRYTVSYREFLFDAAPQEDRDGALHRGVLTQTLRFPDLAAGARFSPYVSLSREGAEGASARNRGWGLGADARVRPLDDLTLFAGGGYRAYRYDNPHVRTNFRFAREDETWHARAGLRYRPTGWATAGVRYSYLDKDSNIPASFSYEQNVVMVTLTLHGP